MAKNTARANAAKSKIGLTNLAFNMRRLVWLEGRPTPG